MVCNMFRYWRIPLPPPYPNFSHSGGHWSAQGDSGVGGFPSLNPFDPPTHQDSLQTRVRTASFGRYVRLWHKMPQLHGGMPREPSPKTPAFKYPRANTFHNYVSFTNPNVALAYQDAGFQTVLGGKTCVFLRGSTLCCRQSPAGSCHHREN